MDFYWLVLGVLAAWRVTHLLNAEDGPWDLGARIRQRAGAGFWGRLLDCFYCLSLWVSAPLAVILGNSAKEGLLLWLALSAGAILFERITAEQPSQASALYFEEQEDRDVLR
jgi:hypothetical protein